jgi:hypothetical protein
MVVGTNTRIAVLVNHTNRLLRTCPGDTAGQVIDRGNLAVRPCPVPCGTRQVVELKPLSRESPSAPAGQAAGAGFPRWRRSQTAGRQPGVQLKYRADFTTGIVSGATGHVVHCGPRFDHFAGFPTKVGTVSRTQVFGTRTRPGHRSPHIGDNWHGPDTLGYSAACMTIRTARPGRPS